MIQSKDEEIVDYIFGSVLGRMESGSLKWPTDYNLKEKINLLNKMSEYYKQKSCYATLIKIENIKKDIFEIEKHLM